MKGSKVFDNKLRQIVLELAPKPIVKCGDIVTTNWGWKKPHRVMIDSIGVEVVYLQLSCGEIDRDYPDGDYPRMGVDLWYCALRLDRNDKPKDKPGAGIVLSNLVTDSGEKWEKNLRHEGFNNRGLSWDIESMERT